MENCGNIMRIFIIYITIYLNERDLCIDWSNDKDRVPACRLTQTVFRTCDSA